jgi:hypothetical protein
MKKTDREKQDTFVQFETLAQSVMDRLRQMSAAHSTFFGLMAAHATFRLQDTKNQLCSNSGCNIVFQEHREVRNDWLNILETSYSRNTVIAAISIFDSFLSDLTKFLLIMYPDAVSKERQVRVGDILYYKSLSDIIDFILGKYIHELSYKSISVRIQYLNQTFGVNLASHDALIDKMQQYAELRNLLIHDVSTYRYKPAHDKGQLQVHKRSDQSDIDWDTAENVLDTCAELIDAIFTATSKHIFECEPSLKLWETWNRNE